MVIRASISLMDWTKEREGCPNVRQQIKKAVVAIAVLIAAGALYLQLKKDNGINDHINAELQRDYGIGARPNDPEMLKDYSSFDRVYQNSNVENAIKDDYGDNSTDNAASSIRRVDDPSKKEEAGLVREAVRMDANVQNDVVDKVKLGNKHKAITPQDFAMSPSPSLLEKNYKGDVKKNMAPSSLTERNHGTHDSLSNEKEGASTKHSFTAPPPIPTQLPSIYTNDLKDAITNSSSVSSTSNTTVHQDDLHSSQVKSKVPLWPLSKLELELFAAKEAIQNVPPSNSSLYMTLHAPIYHNVSQFIKSYELMEKLFKVYIYKEGKGPLVHTGPVTGIYSSEGLFIRQMEQNKQFQTQVVDEALALFLPYSVANMVDELYVPHSTSMLPLSSFIKSYVNEIAARHPFWNRTHGGDHFFIACHDWGLMTTFEHVELRHNAIKILCNADETTEFEKTRDKSLPEFYIHEMDKLDDGGLTREGEGLPGQQHQQSRDVLAFFAGQMHGRVRPELLQYWEYPKGGSEMQVYGVLPAVEVHRMSYKERMHRSRYCLCPMGYEVNSPRVMEAIEALCVPVIIADGFVLPFSHVLDWSSFSITIPEKDIPSLKSILEGIPEQTYMTMQSRLPYVRRHFTWHQNPQPFDTFHMILHSVWTSRLTNITTLQI